MRLGEAFAAGRAWHDLPRDARQEVKKLAKAGQPHPDLGTAEVAARWGEGAFMRGRHYDLLLFAIGGGAAVVSSTGLDGVDPALRPWIVPLTTGVSVAAIIGYMAKQRWPSLVGAVNLAAVAPRQPTLRSPLTVRAAPWPWTFLAGCVVLVVAAIAAALVRVGVTELPAGEAMPLVGLSLVCAGSVAALSLLPMWLHTPIWRKHRPRPGTPIIVADKGGLEFPHLRVRLRWFQVSRIELFPRSIWDRQPIGILIGLHSGRLVLARTDVRPTRQARNLLRANGLAIPVHWIDGDPAPVIHTLQDLHARAAAGRESADAPTT